MIKHTSLPIRRAMRCAVAVLAVAAAASVGAVDSASASTAARSAATPCTPGGTAAQQPVSPSVAPIGNDERQQIVVYRGIGAAAGCLITARSDTGVKIHRLGIAKSSVPVVAEIGGATLRYQVAFQANTGHLWTTGQFGTHSTPLGMAAGTSPAIASSGYGDYNIAFQANTGMLWTTGHLGTRSLHLPMAPGTNPSLGEGGDQVAYQGRNNHVWVTDLITPGKPVVGHDLGLGMMPGTSPSLSSAGNGYQIAFQANSGRLWTTGADGRRNLRYPMSPLSNPSTYRDEIVFTTDHNRVYDVTDTGRKIQALPFASVPGSTPALSLLATPTPAGAMRQYGRQIAYATPITGGSPAELTAGVIDRLYDIP